MSFLLVTLTLALHLACMNVATAGPLVCIWLDWRERGGDLVAGRAGRFIAGWALGLFLAGLVLGVGTALLVWTWEFWQAFQARLPSRIAWGYWELAFSAALMAGYWAWWRFSPGGTFARVARSLLALLASTNLLYHFPPLFVVAAMLASGEAATLGVIDDSTFPRLIWRGEIFALTVHFWLASLAVTGVLLATFALTGPAIEEHYDRPAAWGGRIALVSTLLQIPVGLWLMMELPLPRQNQLLGGDVAGSSLLAGGVLVVLVLLHHLAGLAMGDARRGTILRTAALMAAVIVLMTAALRWSRPERADSVERFGQLPVGSNDGTPGTQLPRLPAYPWAIQDSW